LLLGLSK